MKRCLFVFLSVVLASVHFAHGGDVDDPALQAPPVNTNPGAEYADGMRAFQGIPGIERARNGRLWALWYSGGTGEGAENYVLLVTSGDDGKTWSGPKVVIDPPGAVRAYDPCLWHDPKGKLWVFWAQSHNWWDGRSGVWAITCENSGEENPTWSTPRRLSDGIMMNKPTVLTSGEWLMPAAIWSRAPNSDAAHNHVPGENSGANIMASTDSGATWSLRGKVIVPKRAFDEHMIVERRDGSLWTLVRTSYGIGESVSSDKGKTWSEGKESALPNVNSRFFIRRLSSGKLLLVSHQPPDKKTRSHLVAQLSDDDGKTWVGGLMIDERSGVSYPDGVQAADGTIYIIYDYQRTTAKQILMATFTEEDVVKGKWESPKARQRVQVNQASGTKPKPSEKKAAASKEFLDLALEAPVINTTPGPEYADEARKFNMVIGMVRTPKGRLWACWVSGGDDQNGYFVAATSDDGGASWSKPRLVIDPTDPPGSIKRRTLVGNFWSDPTGRLWLIFDQSLGYFDGRSGVWLTSCDNPDADKPAWSAPKRIANGCTLNKPTVLKNGEWLLPVSLWDRNKIGPPASKENFPELDDQRMAHVFVSSDKGATWTRRGGVKIPGSEFDEHMTVELKDGRLWLLARTNNGSIAESYSSDGGATWSAGQASALKNINSRFFIRRLASGNLLLVKNGLADQRLHRRSNLTALVSDDDGKTWKGGLELDERVGVSYPDGFQAPDGAISIIYDHNRGTDAEILMATFREEDVVAGKFGSSGARGKVMVNKAVGGK